MFEINWPIVIVIAAFALPFGALAFMYFRRAHEINTDETPCVIQMERKEYDAIIRAGIIMPDRGWFAKNGIYVLPLTLVELQELHAEVMEAAQDRIGRAARRKVSTLSGSALYIGTLAGYLHGELLKHWQASGATSDIPGIAPLPSLPHNAPDGHPLT